MTREPAALTVLSHGIPDESSGDWYLMTHGGGTPPLTAYFRDTDAGLLLVRVSVSPLPGQQAVSSQTVRRIPFDELLALARAVLASVRKNPPPAVADPEHGRTRQKLMRLADQQPLRLRGRPSLGADHYERIAKAYLDLAHAGGPDGAPMARGIIQLLAEQEDRSAEIVRDWVHRARNLGYLTKGQPGRAGAEPGPLLANYKPPRRRRGKR